VACGDIDNGNGVFLLFFGVANGESHAVFMLYGVSRLVAWRGVYRFEASERQSRRTWRVDQAAYSCPRKSRK
jgi:hypothetical protein